MAYEYSKTWKRTFTIGRWDVRCSAQVNTALGLGLEVQWHTWSRAYPWISAHAVVACIGLHCDCTRPTRAAREAFGEIASPSRGSL